MKRVFPFALLLCALFAFSGFSPVKSNPLNTSTIKTGANRFWWFPTSGVLVGAVGGDANWSIVTGGLPAPYSITFTRGSETWGPYLFMLQGGTTYLAAAPRALGFSQTWIINNVVSFTEF